MKTQKTNLIGGMVLIFSLITIAISCSKQAVEEQTTKTPGSDVLHSEEDILNICTAFAEVHNQVMRDVGDSPDFPYTDDADLVDFVISDYEQLTGATCTTSQSVFLSMLETSPSMNIFKNAIEDAYDNQAIDAQERQFYLDINDILTGQTSQINSDIDDLVDDVLTSSMSEEQKMNVVQCALIGKYSFNFWQEAMNDPNDPWSQLDPEDPRNQGPLRWLYDAAGWVCGLFQGAAREGALILSSGH